MPELRIGSETFALNEHGYLINRACWTPEVAEALAEKEGIDLTEEHWLVINFLRDFYAAHEVIPPLRIFIKNLKEAHTADLGNSHKLHKLFPDSPLKYACMIAGIPKPKHCM